MDSTEAEGPQLGLLLFKVSSFEDVFLFLCLSSVHFSLPFEYQLKRQQTQIVNPFINYSPSRHSEPVWLSSVKEDVLKVKHH